MTCAPVASLIPGAIVLGFHHCCSLNLLGPLVAESLSLLFPLLVTVLPQVMLHDLLPFLTML